MKGSEQKEKLERRGIGEGKRKGKRGRGSEGKERQIGEGRRGEVKQNPGGILE